VADHNFRQVFEDVYQGRGDMFAENMIARMSKLGEGSEKVVFYIGRNREEQAKMKELLADDPTGITMSAYLGAQMEKAKGQAKRQSSAPEPAPVVRGDTVTTESDRRLRDQYRKADKAGDNQKAFSLRRQARAKGINISDW